MHFTLLLQQYQKTCIKHFLIAFNEIYESSQLKYNSQNSSFRWFWKGLMYQINWKQVNQVQSNNISQVLFQENLNTQILRNWIFLKGCVCYINRCTTSSAYILYTLNENELTISYHIFFYLEHYHLWKRHLPAISILSTNHTVFTKFTVGKSMATFIQNLLQNAMIKILYF